MKNLELWYNWLQKDMAILKNPEVDDDALKAAHNSLLKLSGAMHDNKPRKSKNQAFKLFIYNHIMSDLRRAWFSLPAHLQGFNMYL